MKPLNLFYFWTILLVISGLTLSYYLIPTERDVALFGVRAGKYIEGEQYFQSEYKKGIRTPDIVIPLAMLEQNQGNISSAIAIMQDFIKQNPGNIEALELLGDLYLSSQQYQEYYQTMLELQKYEKKGKALQELADWYQNQNQTESLFQVLKQVVTKEAAQSSNFLDLAHLYAQKGEYKEALSLLEERRKFFPKDVKIDDILFEVWVLDKVSKSRDDFEKQAIPLISNFLIEENKPVDAYYALVNIENQYPYLTPSIIARIQPLISRQPLLETYALGALWQRYPQNQQILSQLQTLYAKNPHDTGLQNVIFNIYVEKGDEQPLLNFIQKNRAASIEENGIINLSIASLNDKPALAKAMIDALGPDYLKKHPVVAASLALGAGDSSGITMLDDLLQKPGLTQQDYLAILRVSAAAGYENEALKAGSKLPPYTGMQDTDLIEIASSYILIKKQKELYSLIEKSKQEMGESQGGAVLAILDTSLDQTNKAARWLITQRNIREPLLNALYFTAEDKKEYPMALYVAKRLQTTYPSPVNQAYYGLALIQVGKVTSGLDLLKNLHRKNRSDPTLEQLYYEGFIFAAQRNEMYRIKLLGAMKHREARPMPLPLQRDFAMAYLEVFHDFAKAEKMFADLSRGASPQNPDLQTLLSIWGPRPTEEQIAFLKNRAETSIPKDLGLWLQDLNYVGQYDTVIDIFEKRSSEDLSPSAYFAYLDALVYEKKRLETQKALDLAYSHISDDKQLENLSSYAEQAGDMKLRKKIWEKIVSKRPLDPNAWQGLAKADFDSHDYQGAETALKKVFSLSGSSYRSNPKLYDSFYQYAEISKRNGSYSRAQEYYALSLYHIDHTKQPTFLQQEMRADILKQRGYGKKALKDMDQLYTQSNDDPDVGAAYGNLLIDSGFLNSAKDVLECGNED